MARSGSIRRCIGAACAAQPLLGRPLHVSGGRAGVIGPGSGRAGASVAAVVALIGVVIGGLALARSAGRIGTGNGRTGPSWPWCWG